MGKMSNKTRNRRTVVRGVLRETTALKKFKKMMSKYGGKLKFDAYGK